MQPKWERRQKFNNQKTWVDGISFDSKKEAKRYGELKQLEKAGRILNLTLQPKFVLQEGFYDSRFGTRKDGSPRKVTAITYVADFQYVEAEETVVEDVKSKITRQHPVYLLKKKLFLAKFKDVVFRET